MAAGALSTAAAVWHGAVEAIDHVLYAAPLTRTILLPRDYPPATVQRCTYAAQVAAIAAHNARVCCGDDENDEQQRGARTTLQLLSTLESMPAPTYNPYKGTIPAEDEATCCRVPIVHPGLPAPEGPSSLTVLVHPRLGQVPAMDWRLRLNVDELLEGSGYRHAHLLTSKTAPAGALARLQARLVEDSDADEGSDAVRQVVQGPRPPRGVLLVGDLGLHYRAARRRRHSQVLFPEEDRLMDASRALVTVLGGRWWRRAPVLAAPPVPLGVGLLPVVES